MNKPANTISSVGTLAASRRIANRKKRMTDGPTSVDVLI
jgi:hypothetical protein